MPNGLAPWPHTWDPTPGNFGAIFNTLSAALGFSGPTLVGTATTNVFVGIPATKTAFVAGASMQGGIAFAGSGAITATLFKNSAGVATALTAAYDLTASISGANSNVDVPITATNVNATLAPGDTLYWAVAAAGTITTTGDLRGVVELALRK
jgi:hypothetical protein